MLLTCCLFGSVDSAGATGRPRGSILEGPIALVSHVGPIKTFLAAAMGLDIAQVRRWFLDPGTITVVDWGEVPLMRTFNSHGHLGWGHAPWIH